MTPSDLKYSVLTLAFSGGLVSPGTKWDFPIKEILFEEGQSPFEVPEHWKWSTLGDCCEMYTGNSIPEAVKKAKYEGLKKGYDYIGTKDVSFNQEIAYNNGVRIPFEENFKIAQQNSVLMCIEGGSAGKKLGIVDRDVCFGNKLCMFNPEHISNKYLFYFLQSLEFSRIFKDRMTGIIGGVSIGKLKKAPIPLPPLVEQRRIVSRLETLLPLVERYSEAWSRLAELNKRFPGDLRKSVLQLAIQGKLVEQRNDEGTGEQLYLDVCKMKKKLVENGTIKKEKPLPEIQDNEIPFEIPENWKWVRLGEIASLCLGKMLDKQKNQGVLCQYLRNVNVRWGTFDLSDLFEMKFEIAEDPRFLIQKGDLVMCEGGEPGRCAVWTSNSPIHFQKALHRIRFYQNLDVVFYQYVFYLYTSQGFLHNFFTGSTINHLTGQALEKVLVPLPPLAEQRRIVAQLELLLPLCDRLQSLQ